MDDLYENYQQNLYKKGNAVYSGDGTPLSTTSEILPSSLGDGFMTGSTEMVTHALQSGTFQTGVRGWQIDAEGNAEFNNGAFRGTFILGGTLETISDITLLQTAINTVSAAGGGTVSFVPNTYTPALNTVFTVPSGVTVDGNGSTIDFGGGAGQFLIQGTNAYSTGTITATFGSVNVVGVGTTWTAGMVGQSILIGDYWYTIASRTDNTHIALSSNFIGTNLAGDTYVIATTVDGVKIQNLTLQNASGTLLRFRYCNGFTTSGCNFFNANQGIDGDDTGSYFINSNSNVDTCVIGITLDNCPFATIDLIGIFNISSGTALDLTRVSNTAIGTFSIQNVTGVAMKFTNCYDIGVINYAFIQQTSHGIEFASGNRDINVSEGYIDTCGGDGIKLTATSDTIQIFGNSILNTTGYGINIAAASCDNNEVGLNTFTNNTAGKINDSGTGTQISGDDTAYNATSWNGNLGTPTKNAVRDKIETLTGGETAALVDDTAYASSWNGVTTIAPSKNAVYDKIEAVVASIPTSDWTSILTLASNFTVTNSSTLTNVTGLTLAVVAGELWKVVIEGFCSGNDGTGDIKAEIANSGTWNTNGAQWEGTYRNPAGGAIIVQEGMAASSNATMLGGVGIAPGDVNSNNYYFRFTTTFLVSGNGNVTFQIANVSSGVGRTSTVYAGARMFCLKYA